MGWGHVVSIEVVRAVAIRAGSVIPDEAVRAGWNIADIGVAVDAEGGERWSARVLGPLSVRSRAINYYRDPQTYYVLDVIDTGPLGTLTAQSADVLIEQIEQLFEALQYGR